MMNYVRRGDTVIVESISRFARNTRDLLDLVERLTEKAGGICKPQGGHRHDHANRQVHAHRIRGYCRTGARSTSCSVSAKASQLLRQRAAHRL